VHEVADTDLAHVGGDLDHLADHLVAEGDRVGGRDTGVRHDERPQPTVEHSVGERGRAPVETQLGAVADPAEPGAQPDFARA
jgi:hypothetical protein